MCTGGKKLMTISQIPFSFCSLVASVFSSRRRHTRCSRDWSSDVCSSDLCDICPRECRVNRLEGERGFCHSVYLPVVSTICAHHGEEPAISGSRGSGTVFFGNCNMRGVYCQNYQISQDWKKHLSKGSDFQPPVERIAFTQQM